MMGKSVQIDGVKRDNLDGRFGERYYIENAHESIVSKETFYRAQAIRQARANPKLVKQEHPSYPFTGMIVCDCCGSTYRHKVNNSGKKWRNDIWVCARQERQGRDQCNSTRIKDVVLREKFIEAYNEFVTLRPQGDTINAIQAVIQELQQEEEKLAGLLMRKLISDKAFRNEQQSIKTGIREQQEYIRQLQRDNIRESEYTTITDFDEAKLKLFVEQIIMTPNHVTFSFFKGVEITKEYTNGQPCNKPGWNKKEV